MTSASNEMQKALYTRLTASLTPTPVYDHVPQSSAFPYVVIGDDDALAWDTKSKDGQEFTCSVHVWNKRVAGRKGVKTTLAAIRAALHHQESSLTLTGFGVVLIRCEFETTLQEAEEGESDHYYHGIQRYRVLVRET